MSCTSVSSSATLTGNKELSEAQSQELEVQVAYCHWRLTSPSQSIWMGFLRSRSPSSHIAQLFLAECGVVDLPVIFAGQPQANSVSNSFAVADTALTACTQGADCKFKWKESQTHSIVNKIVQKLLLKLYLF